MKNVGAMKAERAVKRITFNPSEANLGETLYVSVPKLNEHTVLFPDSVALLFNIGLARGHASNFLLQNVMRAVVYKLVVKYAGAILQGITTSSRSGETFSSRRKGRTTCFSRAFRARTSARSAQVQVTRKPWMSTRKMH